MKFLFVLFTFTFICSAYETYPYKTYERESLGTILYSIGAKRLWGNSGSVLKHQKINKFTSKHEFKAGEVLRIAKEDIRFKCNVELRGNNIIVKKALISKKDRLNLLKENPTCMDDKIVQTKPIVRKKVKKIARKKFIKRKVNKIKQNTFSVSAPKRPSINIGQNKIEYNSISNYKESYKLSYINTRNSMVLNNDTDSVSTVQNSSMGFRLESTRAAISKGMMGSFSLSMVAVNQDNPNYTYDPLGHVGYELGYKFNEKLMLSLMFNANKSQYLNFDSEVSDLFLLESLVNFHYYTSFFKRINKLTFFAGGSQGDNDFRGVSSGLSSEVIIDNLSFGIFYQYRSLFNKDEDLNQNLFGLSLGYLF